MKLSKEMETASKAVIEATQFCKQVQGSSLEDSVVVKADSSPVSIADYGSQAIICRALSKAFPQDNVIAEEHSLDISSNNRFADRLLRETKRFHDPDATMRDVIGWIDYPKTIKKTGRKWVLDPIDGTKGFLRGGQFAIALALMIDDKIELGLLGCPNLPYDGKKAGVLFSAARGYGAEEFWLGDINIRKRIQVSSESKKGTLKFVESVEAEHTDHAFHEGLCKALDIKKLPERLDSQAKYGIVARGGASAYLRCQSPGQPFYRQKIWDHAAGFIIVEEALGKVTDSMGKPLDFSTGHTLDKNIGIVATNGACHDLVIASIAEIAGGLARLNVIKPDAASKKKYLGIVKAVFQGMDQRRIEENMSHFNGKTRFYVFERGSDYVSMVFLRPVDLGPLVLGGVGGVSTRAESRGRGYAAALIRRVIDDSRDEYPAILLWTRIPDFFAKFGFEDASRLFEDDREGSRPMLYFHEPKEALVSKVAGRLPRVYF